MLALLVALLGYVCVAHSLAYVIKSTNPELAHTLAPRDGRIAALLARQLLTPDATPAQRARAVQLARLALQQDATAVPAAATLGLEAQLRGDTQAAQRFFGYAQALSRRDLETQLWAIEDAVARNDIPGALKHYDVTLRTSTNAPEVLYPVLASAVVDPAIRTSLVRTLAGKPLWGPSFIGYVAVKGTDPKSIADFFQRLHNAGIPVSGDAMAAAVNRLITADLPEDAWRYYVSTHPGADRHASRDPRFTANTVDPSPFDWTVGSDAGISASIQRSPKGGVFEFSVPASISGILLQQMQMLPPGNYRIEGHSAGIEQPLVSRPYWVLSCRDGRELGRVVMANSSESNGTFLGSFSVPAGCPVQMLALVARPSDQISGVAGQIDRVELVPVR